MAKFALAGKSDCPFYAKAELLADYLQRCLPAFRIHKISILPEKWTEWLESTCKRNGWKHEQSPLIWRELVDQGGKGILLGGFSNFLEHCQDYYHITSDLSTDMMLSVAEENIAAKLTLIAEEQHRLCLVQPMHLWITGALSPTCPFLIPNLLSTEVFSDVSMINLHLLDLEGNQEELQGLRMETEDLAAPLLHQVTIHTDLEQGFHDADVIVLLDDWRSGDSDRESMLKTVGCYKEYGRLIDKRAKKAVKVIVAGDSFVNLRCSLLLENAPSVDCSCFVAVATQVENQARAILAKKLKVRTSDVTDVIMWGNISGSFYIDLQRAKVFNYDGAIKGPAFFSQPVEQILYEKKWLETEFQDLVRYQSAAVAGKTGRPAVMSAAHGILAVLKAWRGAGPDNALSVGVPCQGAYDIPEDMVLSVPAALTDGKWSVLSGVPIGDKLKDRLQLSAAELAQEKELACNV